MLRKVALMLMSGLLIGCTPGMLGSLTNSPGVSTVQPTTEARTYTGRVLGLDGKPAAGVEVQGYLISNNTGSLISHNGSKYGIQAEDLKTLTDVEGRFSLASSTGLPMNVEAVLSSEVKAIRLKVDAGARDLTLQLAYTGTLSGRVTAPSAPTVTDFTGVDVFIPGTSYLAKTNATGMFTLSNVAVGTFDLVATKQGLGRGNAAGVVVESKKVTTTADIPMSVTAPVVSSLSQANGGPGSLVTLTGEYFGASTGETFDVSFSGAIAANPERLDDRTIRVAVPDAAVTGAVVVTVSGIRSNATPFTVIDRLEVSPEIAYLKAGRPQPYAVTAYERDGKVVENPSVTWGVTGAAATFSNGAVTFASTGKAVLSVLSGSKAATRSLEAFSGPVVNTVAGGVAGFQDGRGSGAKFAYPNGLTVAPDGTLYVADRDNHRIRRIAPGGDVTTVAGSERWGNTNAVGDAAQFNSPVAVALDGKGSLVVSETGNHQVRKVNLATREVTTLAGSGVAGSSDYFAPFGQASFNAPHGLAVDASGSVLVADWLNSKIRKIEWSGLLVMSFAGRGLPGFIDATASADAVFSYPIGVAIDPQGVVYVSDMYNNRIRRIADGMVTTYYGDGDPALLNRPHDLALDASGNLYVADSQNHRVVKIRPDRTAVTLAGSTRGYSDGAGATAQFNELFGVAVGPDGSVYVGDRNNNRIRVITP